MRLDDMETSGVDVEDQRGQASFGGGGGFPLLALLPLTRRLGCGGIALLLVLALVMGFNPISWLGGGAPQSIAPHQMGQSNADACTVDAASKYSCQVLASANTTWAKAFPAGQYKPPGLVFYTREGQSGCGAAQSAMGPFYCPADQKIYLDTDFYQELSGRFGASGDFAQAYVIAHEVGHHIQDLEGTLASVHDAQRQLGTTRANALQVKVELQADCYAGVWA